MLLFRLACLLPFVAFTWALHESDVGVVDWHKHLVGVPLSGSVSNAPVFHRVGVGKKETQSVILTATTNNVLAALNPVDGSVVWRHVFDTEDQIAVFHKHDNVVAVLSGPGGATLRSFEIMTGHLILEKRMHHPETGHTSEPRHLGKYIAFANSSRDTADMFVLSDGYKISQIDGATGNQKWTWSSPDQSSQVIYSTLVTTPKAIYAVGITKSIRSFTLHVVSISPDTGEVLASTNVPSSIENPLTEYLTIGHANTYAEDSTPHIVWLENGVIKSLSLTPSLKGKPKAMEGSDYKEIVDVGLCDHGQLVGVKKTGASGVIRLAQDGSALKSIWDFQGSDASDATKQSLFSGGFDKDGRPYIVRVYWAHSLQKAAADIYAPHLADGKGLVTGFAFPFDAALHGVIGHVAIDAANPGGWTILARLAITTTTGAVQLWQQDKIQWTREESLAAVVAAEFVELPERVVSSSRVGDEQESFYARVLRQMSDAQDFPQYLVNFAKRFATGSYASASSSAAVSADNGVLSRDTFGFRQVIVAATVFGKVYGIDTSNGDILWSRVLGLGGSVQPVKLFVTRTVSDGETPQVVVVAQRRFDDDRVDTAVFHLNALTGEDATGSSQSDDATPGIGVLSGPLVEAYLINKILVLLDERLEVYLYPDTEENQKTFAELAPSLHIPLRANSQGQRRVMGHRLLRNPEADNRFAAYSTWTLSLSQGEHIRTLLPASRSPVASIGKVLGNRTTLYKYLNPRLFTLLTASHVTSPPTCGIYVADSTKGSIVYRATLPSSGGKCEVRVSLVENWLVYHYYDEDVSGVGQAKGYRMVSVELYEGKSIDDKTRSSDMSSFSDANVNISAFEQAYVFPHAITAISATSTKFGISAKDIIVATKNHKIQSFQRRLLNPRRPNRKPTTEEQEEFLVQYDPVLPDDPRRVLSHNYEVANIQRIVTSPALLESTSLVFAYGLDMFLTRVAPSNTFDVLSENFNKAQLVLTVSGLALAIIFTKPMVRRKRLRERWYQ